MNSRMNRVVLAAAVLGAALAASAPAFADGHGHGDGNRGGSFAAGRGGASMSHGAGPVGGRPAASYGRSGGFGAGHTGGSGYSGGHFSAPAGGRYGYSPGRVSSSPRYSSAPGYRSGNFAGRSSGYRPVRGIGVGGRPHSWGGGYYRGSYWPRSYYRSGFVRFWPVLPAFYSTFWFGGLPYYYWGRCLLHLESLRVRLRGNGSAAGRGRFAIGWWLSAGAVGRFFEPLCLPEERPDRGADRH